MKHTLNPQLRTILPRCGAWVGAFLISAATVHASTTLTFHVDMSAQVTAGTFVPGTDTVSISGTLNGWSTTATPLTQVGSTSVYTTTVVDTDDANGATMSWKIVDSDPNFGNGGYETPADYNNRTITLPTAGGPLDMPYVYCNDAGPTVSPPINVTFNVDMSVEAALGNWTPADGVVVKGNFNGWSGTAMTQVGSSDVFTVTIPISTSTNAADDFKYTVPSGYLSTVNSGYESVSGANQDGGGNRWLYTSPTFANLPKVFYDDQQFVSTEQYLTNTVNVTFNVDMTGAVGTDGYVFGEDDAIGGGNDVVCINGVYNGSSPSWETWTTDGSVSQDQPFIYGPLTGLTMSPSGSNPNIWTITLPIDTGNYENLTYKYSINGWDDEAGFNDNHTRWIRNEKTGSWTMPTDKFGGQGTTTSAETEFGDLVMVNNNNGTATISWLGIDGVELQSAPSPTGPWTKIPSTDGTVLTVSDPSGMVSYTVNTTGAAKYFELVQPVSE